MGKINILWPITIGIGLALFPVHNQFLTNLMTNADGETLVFIPAIGTLMWIMGSGLFLLNHWDKLEEIGWGSQQVVTPLFVIVIAIGLSGVNGDGLGGILAPLLAGICMFCLYLVGRVLREDIFIPIVIGTILSSIGVIISSVITPGVKTGGLVFEYNYDIIVGFTILGMCFCRHKLQYILVSLVLIAMFLTGSPEAIFVVGVLSAAVLFRGDIGYKLLVILIPVVMVAFAWFQVGIGQDLYSYTLKVARNEPTVPIIPEDTPIPILPEQLERFKRISAVDYRLDVIGNTLKNLKPLGEGYNLTDLSRVKNIHNVPLVIVQQLGYPGILAGFAWLWVTFYCLFKTRWKYAWIAVLALSVFDHYIWTQLAPYWWVLVGVSSVSNTEPDYVFKGG